MPAVALAPRNLFFSLRPWPGHSLAIPIEMEIYAQF
jgi:hypothetical protein